jgi:6-phosphogluconolactonase
MTAGNIYTARRHSAIAKSTNPATSQDGELNTDADMCGTIAVAVLQKMIKQYGNATWVLAGGTTPIAAYELIESKHKDDLDWSKVTMLLGDERIGSDYNGHEINQALGSLPTTRLFPNGTLKAEDAAGEYEVMLGTLPKGDSGLPRLDLVWLGVGADGHTLSLFPSHASLLPSGGLVVAVHDSPKPPSNRVSLTLRAMQAASNVMILASGADKKAAVKAGMHGGSSPIGLAVSIVKTHEGKVTWLVDKASSPRK